MPSRCCSSVNDHVEVEVEVAAERGRPGNVQPIRTLVRLQLRERRARDRPKHDVVVSQVHGRCRRTRPDRRAGRTTGLVVGAQT